MKLVISTVKKIYELFNSPKKAHILKYFAQDQSIKIQILNLIQIQNQNQIQIQVQILFQTKIQILKLCQF